MSTCFYNNGLNIIGKNERRNVMFRGVRQVAAPGEVCRFRLYPGADPEGVARGEWRCRGRVERRRRKHRGAEGAE